TPTSPQTFIGRLANGVSVELVGLSETPSTAKSWWRADGSPLPDAPYVRMSGGSNIIRGVPPSEEIRREVAVRVNAKLDNGAEDDPATVSWGLAPSSQSMSSSLDRPRSPDVEGVVY